MTKLFYSASWILKHLQEGPLAPHIGRFAALLSEQGYARPTGRQKIRLIAELSRWLHRRQLEVINLDEKRIKKFLKYRHRHGGVHRGDATTLEQLIEQLRGDRVVSMPAGERKDSELHCVERGFAQYLAQERGLSRSTTITYLPIIRRFLSEHFGEKPIILNKLNLPVVTRFILGHAHTNSPGRAKLMVTALRSFFRYLRVRGDITTDLAASVPSVADWRLSTLPKSLEPKEVKRLLKSCDLTTSIGRRDYTILLFLARLGLRAGEVVAMTIDDINWDAGELIIHGKGLRTDRLPLPYDVGKALATYLRYGRPSCSTRRVFIRMKAPRREFASSVAISTIVRRAIERTGLHPDRKGAHLLRHSFAIQMLQGGASLSEIGEILRHRLPSTTEIYTKVSLAALRALAQPWPGGVL